jgi:transposase
MTQEKIILTPAEMKKILVIEKLMNHHMTTKEAATVLGISIRQVLRLKATYQQEGAQGLAHKNRGRQPIHAISEKVKKQIVQLYDEKYYGSNNSHFADLLEEHENIKLSVPSVRRFLTTAGVKQARPHRRPKAHRPRNRKPQAGMLWQIDASSHDWLEGRRSKFTLLAAIDDATGVVVGAIFRENETMEGYFQVMRQGIQDYGLPAALYSDRHTIFRSPNEVLTVEQELAGELPPLSNFGQAMKDLTITHIKARTPQAKGRIERLWGTLQDRLLIELRLLQVCTIEEANNVLNALICKHNKRFAVKPKECESVYIKLPKDLLLDHVFSTREYRKIGQGQTLSFGSKVYTISAATGHELIPSKTKVEVRQSVSGGPPFLWYQEKAFALVETQKPQSVTEKKTASALPSRKPAADHPWKKWVGPKELQKSSALE